MESKKEMKVIIDRRNKLIRLKAETQRETKVLTYLSYFLYHDSLTHRVVKHSFGYPHTAPKFRKRLSHYAKRQELTLRPIGEYAIEKFEAL